MAYQRKMPYKSYHSLIQDIKCLTPSPDIEYFFDDITGDRWEEFKESIRRNGILTPLIVSADGKMILAGRQRYRACLELGIDRVPIECRPVCDRDDERMTIIESNIRQRGVINSPSVKLGRIILELERIYGADNDKGGCPAAGQLSRKSIRESIGVDKQVANCSKGIAKMPEEMQSLITDGVITPRVAYDHLVSRSEAEQKAVAAAIRNAGMDRVDTKQMRKLLNKDTEPKGDLKMLQTDSVFSITRQILGQDVVISLTDAEAEQIVRQWIDRDLEKRNQVQEPETKKEWKPVKAYTTGVIAQHGDDVITMYQQGKSCHVIAEHYGVSDATVSRFLRNSGVPMRTPQDANKLRWGKRPAA